MIFFPWLKGLSGISKKDLAFFFSRESATLPWLFLVLQLFLNKGLSCSIGHHPRTRVAQLLVKKKKKTLFSNDRQQLGMFCCKCKVMPFYVLTIYIAELHVVCDCKFVTLFGLIDSTSHSG